MAKCLGRYWASRAIYGQKIAHVCAKFCHFGKQDSAPTDNSKDELQDTGDEIGVLPPTGESTWTDKNTFKNNK
jgi:hypothetical protein